MSDPGSLRDRLLWEVEVAAVDLEFTGLDAETDRVCEAAVVRGTASGEPRAHTWLVRPPVPMSPAATACTGLTDAALAGAPPFAEVAHEVRSALEGAVFVAHNVPFDLGYLLRELELAGRDWAPPATLDTLLMSRRLFAFPRNNLAELCERLDVPTDGAHRALPDAAATFRAFWRMCDILDPERGLTVGELDDLLGALAPNSPLRLRQKRTLVQAHRDRTTVWIDYQSTADPGAGLTHREVAIWFVRVPRIQGWCHLRRAERVFRLDRMRTVEEGGQTYEVPADATRRI